MITNRRGEARAVAVRVAAGVAVITLCLIGAGLLVSRGPGHAAIERWDLARTQQLIDARTESWTRLANDATHMANTFGVVAIGVIAALALMMMRRRRWAAVLMIALPAELLVFLTTSYTVRRPRPDVDVIGSTPSTFSWPSGHVAATLVLYGTLALAYSRSRAPRVAKGFAWCVAAALTLTVGWARVYRGQHHVTDTVAGVLMGLAVLTLVVRSVRALHEQRPPTAWFVDLSDRMDTQHREPSLR